MSIPVIGISIGDINGIGPEIIIKALQDNRITQYCTPVVFGSSKAINFYKKTIHGSNFNFNIIKDSNAIKPGVVNVFNCWDDEVAILPGELTDAAGKCAVLSLETASKALLNGKINALVTAPIHKKNVQSDSFNFTGHTPFLKHFFGAKEVLMLLFAQNMKVGLVTEHLPVQEVSKHLSQELIVQKIELLDNSLKADFCISKPKIAVLSLNPHAGDEGLIGKEEIEIINPAIKQVKDKGILALGPYSSDAFFARGTHEKFDAVLAMYHDQGMIPVKSLSIGEGVNFTAGLNVIRTSPDHGTAFDIAAKNKADESSMREAIYAAIDIYHNRIEHKTQRQNPLRRQSHKVLGKAVDEKLTEFCN